MRVAVVQTYPVFSEVLNNVDLSLSLIDSVLVDRIGEDHGGSY